MTMVLSGMEFPHTVVLSGCLEKRVCDMKRRMVGLCMDFIHFLLGGDVGLVPQAVGDVLLHV